LYNLFLKGFPVSFCLKNNQQLTLPHNLPIQTKTSHKSLQTQESQHLRKRSVSKSRIQKGRTGKLSSQLCVNRQQHQQPWEKKRPRMRQGSLLPRFISPQEPNVLLSLQRQGQGDRHQAEMTDSKPASHAIEETAGLTRQIRSRGERSCHE